MKTMCTRRLAMKEILHLPVTFTNDNLPTIGYKNHILLHGSGLWMADINLPWGKLWHESPSRILEDVSGNFFSAVWDEGWNLTIQMLQLNLRVAHTRCVDAKHLGGGVWDDCTDEISQWETDAGDTDQSWILGRCEKTTKADQLIVANKGAI
jgi:hypothetical protein